MSHINELKYLFSLVSTHFTRIGFRSCMKSYDNRKYISCQQMFMQWPAALLENDFLISKECECKNVENLLCRF